MALGDNGEVLIPSGRKLRVLLLSSDTGGGHRASAAAIRAALEEALPNLVHVEVVDFWVEFAKGPFTKFPQQYAFLAKHPILWKTTYELTRFPPVRFITESVFDTLAHQRIRQAFDERDPDLIVSVHPLINTLSLHVLKNMSRATNKPRAPYVTVVTDLGGAHPTWFHPDADMTYVPSLAIEAIAAKCHVANHKVERIGLPVRRDFWDSPPDKQTLRSERGLANDSPAILLIGGGDGVGKLGNLAFVIARRLYAQAGPNAAQLVIVCGSNTALAKQLSEASWPIPVIVKGYVSDMSDWMAAVDIICTKAGPGTIAEALIRGLPIMLHSFLPGQEAANVRFVVDNNVGEYATRPRRIAGILARWISNPELVREMSVRALELGAPQATQNIVKHMLVVAAQHREKNERDIATRSRMAALVRRSEPRIHLLAGRHVTTGIAHSHLLYHLRGLLRFAVGAVIARDAFSYMPPNFSSFFRESSHDTVGGSRERSLRHSIELPARRKPS